MMNDLTVGIKVKLKSPKFGIKSNEQITVFCKSHPEKGRANREIIKEFEKIFKTEVQIISGLKSKNKRLLLKDIGGEEFSERLRAWTR